MSSKTDVYPYYFNFEESRYVHFVNTIYKQALNDSNRLNYNIYRRRCKDLPVNRSLFRKDWMDFYFRGREDRGCLLLGEFMDKRMQRASQSVINFGNYMGSGRIPDSRYFINDDLNIKHIIDEFLEDAMLEEPPATKEIRIVPRACKVKLVNAENTKKFPVVYAAGVSFYEFFRFYGYNCLLPRDIVSLSMETLRLRDALAMEFVNVDTFADEVISACNMNSVRKGRMAYTNYL